MLAGRAYPLASASNAERFGKIVAASGCLHLAGKMRHANRSLRVMLERARRTRRSHRGPFRPGLNVSLGRTVSCTAACCRSAPFATAR